jgi:rubredoxin---NAD+ reductase
MLQNLVIIGSGLAGYMLAKEWRKLDNKSPLTIITASEGNFYSKPLLSTSLTQQKTPDMLAMKSSKDMEQELNAIIHNNSVVEEIDLKRRVISFNDDEILFSHCVLATGANKIAPPLKGDAVSDIQSVNNLQDYSKFRAWLKDKKHIAILGAGLVGCEFANDLINVGIKVDIIAPETHALASLVPEPIGNQLVNALANKGVTWHLGRLAKAVNKNNNQYEVLLSDKSTVMVDGVMSAIGLKPNLGLAELAGIKTNRGIQVNRYLQTNEKNIFAVGDCAEVDGEVRQYVAPLLQCARALAKVLAGAGEPVHYPTMPVVIKTPACPVVSSPPPINVAGDWHFEGEGSHLKALYYDEQGQLRGFALVGDKVRDKMPLAKQLPLVFAE